MPLGPSETIMMTKINQIYVLKYDKVAAKPKIQIRLLLSMITLHTVVKFIVYMLHVHCYAQYPPRCPAMSVTQSTKLYQEIPCS